MKACRTLVMEDDPLMGMLRIDLLEKMGCDICAIAATAADDATAAAQYRPDQVIAGVRVDDGR